MLAMLAPASYCELSFNVSHFCSPLMQFISSSSPYLSPSLSPPTPPSPPPPTPPPPPPPPAHLALVTPSRHSSTSLLHSIIKMAVHSLSSHKSCTAVKTTSPHLKTLNPIFSILASCALSHEGRGALKKVNVCVKPKNERGRMRSQRKERKEMSKGERERDVIHVFHKFFLTDLDKHCTLKRCIIIVYSFPLYRVGFSHIFWYSLRSRKGTALMGVAHAHFPPYG